MATKEKQKKRIGDLQCIEIECSECPFDSIIHCGTVGSKNTLDEFLEEIKTLHYMPDSVYQALKNELNKEVEDDK